MRCNEEGSQQANRTEGGSSLQSNLGVAAV